MERKGLVCLLFLALAGWGLARAEERNEEKVTLLQANAAVTREIHDGEVHLYRLPLKAGDYAHVEIIQQGVDVEVVLRDPAGAVLQKVDTPTGRYSKEVVSFVAGTEGDHRLEVKPLFLEGAYRLALNDIRPASREDRLRIEAEKADHEAFNDLASALLAVERWRELEDRQGEAWAMTRLGLEESPGTSLTGTSSPRSFLAWAFRYAVAPPERSAHSQKIVMPFSSSSGLQRILNVNPSFHT